MTLGGIVDIERELVDPAHNFVHALGDLVGYWWIVVILGLGAFIVVPKLVKKWLHK